MTEERRQQLQKAESDLRDKKNEYLNSLDGDSLITERDAYLATLPQDAPVTWERDILNQAKKTKKQEQEEDDKSDPTLAAMRRDIRKMYVEIKWNVLNQLLLAAANNDLTNLELIELYRALK